MLKLRKNNKSGYLGVGFHKRSKKWRAFLMHENKQISLGQYDIIEEAANAYNQAALLIFDKDAELNQIPTKFQILPEGFRNKVISSLNRTNFLGKKPKLKKGARIPSCHPESKHFAKGFCQMCYTRKRREDLTGYQIEAEARREAQRSDEYKQKSFARRIKYQYGLTLDQYNVMFNEQQGKCKICEQLPRQKSLHIDHRHDTGKVRGLLCTTCNWFMGKIDTNIKTADNLDRYIKENK